MRKNFKESSKAKLFLQIILSLLLLMSIVYLVINALTSAMIRNTKTTAITGLIVNIGILLYLAYTFTKTRKERDRYMKNSQEMDHIISALGTDYANIFIVDVESHESKAVLLDSGLGNRLGIEEEELHKYEDDCNIYIDYYFHPEDRDFMRKSMDMETVLAELSEKDIFTGNFRIVLDERIHYFQFKYSMLQDGKHFILGFQNTDQLVADELERNRVLQNLNDQKEAQLEEIKGLNQELREKQNSLEESAAEQEAQLEEIGQLNNMFLKTTKDLQENLNIIQSIAEVYHSLYYVDMETLSFVEQGTSAEYIEGVIGTVGNAKMAMEAMCKHIITAEMTDDMADFVNFDTLNDRMKDRNWISKQFLGQSGKWSEGSFVAVSRDSEGNLLKVVWAVRDIDEAKKKELEYQRELETHIRNITKLNKSLAKARRAAEEANKAKSTFLFNMSHDIRTPMNAIMGYTQLLEQNLKDELKCKDYIAKIKGAEEFLLSLINNVLEMARIESGEARLDEVVVNAGEVYKEITAVYIELMKEKNITFKQEVNVSTEYIFSDVVKIKEVFLNLISNAYKYTSPGGEVSVLLRELPCKQEGVVLVETVVSDTGIGMSEEFLKDIFEEFSRERSSVGNEIQGTGLGLSIVKKLVDVMDGTISVKSKLGEGTTFVVTIPHKIAQDPNIEKSEAENINTNDFKDKKILLAEDNDLNAEIAVALLENVGFLVDRVCDGVECIDRISQVEDHEYDLILMDIQMPNMDGYKAAQAIRRMDNPSKSAMPIFAMTANAFEEDKQKALEVGMNGHISKPINVDKMLETIASVIQK